MTEVSAFFDELERTGYDPELHEVSGTVRFDIQVQQGRSEHWVLTLDGGRMHVIREWREAQAVVTITLPLAERMVRGQVNALAAMLRGEILVEGDLGLIIRLGRLFPPSPEAKGPRRRNRGEGRA